MIIEIDDELLDLLQKEYDYWTELYDKDITIQADESYIRIGAILSAVRALEGFVKK